MCCSRLAGIVEEVLSADVSSCRDLRVAANLWENLLTAFRVQEWRAVNNQRSIRLSSGETVTILRIAKPAGPTVLMRPLFSSRSRT